MISLILLTLYLEMLTTFIRSFILRLAGNSTSPRVLQSLWNTGKYRYGVLYLCRGEVDTTFAKHVFRRDEGEKKEE